MGCATSKLDDLPAVALCRHRCAFLEEAVRHRFAFAEAHAAYLLSLDAVGLSLHRFFNQDLDASSLGPPSPVLNLPPPRKGDPLPPESSGSPPGKTHHHLHSRSDSGSHLRFDSDSDDSGSDSLHHHDGNSPVHHHQGYGGVYMPDYSNLNFNLPGGGGGGGGFMNISYMKKETTPSVVYTQRPMSPETMHIGESSANPSSYYPNPINGYSSYGGIFDGSYPAPSQITPVVASTSKAPPPPPSAPESSTWDFLNPFEASEKYYPAYSTPTNDSKEVREEEGIPDLEDDDDDDDEVVKEVHGDQKLVHGGRASDSKPVAMEEGLQNHTVYKNAGEERLKNGGNAAEYKGFKDDLEVVKEIQVQFHRASESGNDLAKFLEVGKLHYRQKRGNNHVSSKLLHLPMVSSKTSDNGDSAFLDIHEDVELMSKNLSSTLHKLYLWEKKLYEEVKVEEKMRVLLEKKSEKIKRMDERGSEAHKVDATRSLIKSLSTKIKIAIQVVDKISVKINRLRDEELWPLLNEFIQGLTRMWKSMVECHRNQCQAIGEAKWLDTIASHLSDSHFEATRQLQHDLINWTLWFSNWIDAQRSYVRALNNWLMKCLLYIPEETDDGPVPFSPGRIGAPMVFIVCHQWRQSLDGVSEKEVVDSMRDLATNVLHLWEKDKMEMRQKMVANREDRKMKSLEKEEQKMNKEIQALDRRMELSTIKNGVVLSTRPVYQSETSNGASLQSSLQHVLEAMGQFTANSLKMYEELLQRIKDNEKQVS